MFAAKEIPDEWLKEKAKKRSLNLLSKLRETK
jgi:hypothetical protein